LLGLEKEKMANQKGGIKVIIADDHPYIRLGLRRVLEGVSNISVVDEASNGQEAVKLVELHHPDVLILDISMPVMDGFQVMDYLRKCKSLVRIVVLSAHNDNEYISEALSRGAWGYYLKEEAPFVIAEAVLQAGRGDGQGTRPRPRRLIPSNQAGVI
jgi:DNA-binding NarL/FixJ family response regulator